MRKLTLTTFVVLIRNSMYFLALGRLFLPVFSSSCWYMSFRKSCVCTVKVIELFLQNCKEDNSITAPALLTLFSPKQYLMMAWPFYFPLKVIWKTNRDTRHAPCVGNSYNTTYIEQNEFLKPPLTKRGYWYRSNPHFLLQTWSMTIILCQVLSERQAEKSTCLKWLWNWIARWLSPW